MESNTSLPKNINISLKYNYDDNTRQYITKELKISNQSNDVSSGGNLAELIDLGNSSLNKSINSVPNALNIITILHIFKYTIIFNLFDEHIEGEEEGYFSFGSQNDIVGYNKNIWEIYQGEDNNDLICSSENLFFLMLKYNQCYFDEE